MKFFFYLPILVIAVTYLYNAIKGNAIHQWRRDLNNYKKQKKSGINLADTPNKLAWGNLSDTQAGSIIWFLGAIISGLVFSFIGLLSFNWIEPCDIRSISKGII